MSLQLLVLVLAVLSPGALPASLKKMSMARMHSSDLETSASGYIYTHVSGQPSSYVHFTNNAQGVPQYQAYQHVPPVQYYVQPQVVVPEKIVQQEAEEIEDHEGIEEAPLEELIEEGEGEEYNEDGSEGYADGDSNAGYAEGGNEFESSGGEAHQKAHHSAHGEKGDKGYENKHKYSKGEKGSHDNKHSEGHYAANGGQKAGHYDAAGHYHSHHEGAKGQKGEEHGEKAYHKKGQKTTGFHNVYHKDEYKKDHTFYDESDKSGFHKKHGGQEAHKSSENGGYKKGGNHQSGHHADNYGKKGSHDKGHYDQADEGYKGQQGHEQHHSSYADYAKEGGKEGGKSYGYKHGGGIY